MFFAGFHKFLHHANHQAVTILLRPLSDADIIGVVSSPNTFNQRLFLGLTGYVKIV